MNKCSSQGLAPALQAHGSMPFPIPSRHGGGIISLLYTTVRAYGGKYSQEDYHGVQLASIYWHFVDLCGYIYSSLTLIR